jgi:hypothetical protein
MDAYIGLARCNYPGQPGSHLILIKVKAHSHD